jgi:hypothetical protein
MGLPSNIEELGNTNSYLFKLLLLANKENKIKGVEVGHYHTTFARNPDTETFLQGFGVPLVKGELPSFKVKTRGLFGRGLSSAVKYMIGNIPTADISLLKLTKCKSAPEEVFKDPWGKSHVTEKRILDNIIVALKRCKIENKVLDEWLHPWEKIMEKNGIDKKILDNQLIDEIEREWIQDDFKESLAVASAVPEFKTEEKEFKILSLGKELKRVIKLFKPLKSFVGDLVSLRLKVLYGHKDNTALKRRKRPIGELKRNIAMTKEFVNAFNIGRGGQVRPPYLLPYFPSSNGEWQTLKGQIDVWYASIAGEQMRLRAGVVHKWLQGAITE